MKNLMFLAIVCLLTSLTPVRDKITQQLIVHPSSTLTINGKTNVNKYHCAIEKYTGSDTLLLTAERGRGTYFKKGLAQLSIAEFECSMDVITKDFSEMLQSEKYPYIKIDFLSFERVPKYADTEEKFSGHLTITLANVAVPCQVRCSIVKDENNLIHLRGKRNFKFSDFKLKPPTKMMGMVKVDEKIAVDFHLVLSMK